VLARFEARLGKLVAGHPSLAVIAEGLLRARNEAAQKH
jgi:hypothetical protein